jgi:hypothetical protein
MCLKLANFNLAAAAQIFALTGFANVTLLLLMFSHPLLKIVKQHLALVINLALGIAY